VSVVSIRVPGVGLRVGIGSGSRLSLRLSLGLPLLSAPVAIAMPVRIAPAAVVSPVVGGIVSVVSIRVPGVGLRVGIGSGSRLSLSLGLPLLSAPVAISVRISPAVVTSPVVGGIVSVVSIRVPGVGLGVRGGNRVSLGLCVAEPHGHDHREDDQHLAQHIGDSVTL